MAIFVLFANEMPDFMVSGFSTATETVYLPGAVPTGMLMASLAWTGDPYTFRISNAAVLATTVFPFASTRLTCIGQL